MKRTKQKKVPIFIMVTWLMVITFGVVSLISGCSAQEINPASLDDNFMIDSTSFIRNHYYESERTLVITPTVEDTLGSSTATINQQATFYHQLTDTRILNNPNLYISALITKRRIDVKSAEDIPATVVKSYILSRTPYRRGLVFGEDVIKVFELSDSNQVQVHYGWQYMAVLLDKDTLALPHGEFTSVDLKDIQHENFGTKTDLEDPYLMRVVLDANLVTKGVSGQQTRQLLKMKPWYLKVVSSEPIKVIDVHYNGKYEGCPNPVYKLEEVVTTNKEKLSIAHQAQVSVSVTAPQNREQPSLDSLFDAKSVGKLSLVKVSEIKNEEGFTMRTMSGTYLSSAKGKTSGTVVENTAYVTIQYPVKFESIYGHYDIAPLTMSFDELEFKVTKISETDKVKKYNAVNRIQGKLGSCTLDVIDETVTLLLQKEKPSVVAVDSTYTLTGDGDEYKVDKEIIWSDNTKTHTYYSYIGRHEAKAYAFGEVITTSLNWSAGTLTSGTVSKSTEEKKFSNVTKFVAEYTTTDWTSAASNGKQNGVFRFSEIVPKVTFVDGKVQKTFALRSYAMTGMGATLASDYNIVVRNAVSYKAYDYPYIVQARFNNGTVQNLISEGKLLLAADEAGEPKYEASLTWSGYTATAKVIKTTPHTFASDEVETFTESATLSLGALKDGRLDADNTNFAVAETKTETKSTVQHSPWEKVLRERQYSYVLSNGTVMRSDLVTKVEDAVITFNDGKYQHTFDLSLDVQHKENFGGSYRDGDYNVTPHRLTVTATSNGKALQTTGVTSIYVKRTAEIIGHTEKTVVSSDGTVDAVVILSKDDGTTETHKASDVFGHRFAFNFQNASAQEKIVTKVGHQASGLVGGATTNPSTSGAWTVTENRYPYTETYDNGVTADKFSAGYAYSNFEFVYKDSRVGTISVPRPEVSLGHKSLTISKNGTSGGYTNYDAQVLVTAKARGTEGSYQKDLAVTHRLKVKDTEPDGPHLGKPKAFYVTAVFDPSAQITRRAFVFRWEQGVTYAVCPYETMLPATADFKYKTDTYSSYNSVGYVSQSADPWQPARGSDDTDAIRWYYSNGTLMSAIDKNLTCKIIGWKNLVDEQYALFIPGYTYTMDGYNITVQAPNGMFV